MPGLDLVTQAELSTSSLESKRQSWYDIPIWSVVCNLSTSAALPTLLHTLRRVVKTYTESPTPRSGNANANVKSSRVGYRNRAGRALEGRGRTRAEEALLGEYRR